MGEPKLLLPLGGESLVRRVAREAAASRASTTVVVTGANRIAVERELAGLPVTLVHNSDYSLGMSTSLQAGLAALPPDIGAAAVLLADQPLVTRGVVNALIASFEDSGAPIVRPRYKGEAGHPIVWRRDLFSELMSQKGDKGGRDMLRHRAAEIVWVDLPHAEIAQDVDTAAEYELLRAAVEQRPPEFSHHHEKSHGEPRFCPACGAALERCTVEGKRRPVCTACGSVFWQDPKVAVAALIPWGENGSVLLGRRAIDPGKGRWSFPSGYVDRGEDVQQAARREVLEETGLHVDIGGLVGVYSAAGHPVVLIVYMARHVGGAACPGPEVSELAGFTLERLPDMAFQHDEKIIREWLAIQRRGAARQ